MANPFVHIELMSTDVGKAKAFYGKLFDWKLEDMPMPDMTYTMIKVGEGTGGGDHEKPNAERALHLGSLCGRRRSRRRDGQGQITWRYGA